MRDITKENQANKPAEIEQECLTLLYVYLTEGCNLACRHCWLNPKFQGGTREYPVLPLELFKSIVLQAKPLGLTTVKLTGGEPLMHPRITDLLKIIRENDLYLGLETNGILCSRRLAREIAACKIQGVSVSLDGINAETHESIRGVKGSFSASIIGIIKLVEAGVKPQIIMTLMRKNKDQVAGMVRIAELLGASSIKFGFVNPSGRGAKMKKDGETLEIEELLELRSLIEDSLAPITKVKLHYPLPMAFRNLSNMFGKKGCGCMTCDFEKMIGVLASGHYALCGIGELIPELVYGNAAKDRLEDIWKHSKKIQQLRGDVHTKFEGVCGNCLMKRMCRGLCIAQNYYQSGSLWKSYWFCEEAYKKGLFPETRLQEESAPLNNSSSAGCFHRAGDPVVSR